MLLREGFPGQRLRVLPQPLARAALRRPITGRLLVTDAGHFPHAGAHGRARPHGAPEAIVIVCVAGAGLVEIADAATFRVGPGQAFVIPRNVRHRYRADSSDPWTIWWLHVAGTDADELVGEIAGSDGSAPLEVRDVFSAVEMIKDAVSALEQDETAAMLYLASGAAWRLLTMLASDRLRGRATSHDRIEIVQNYLRNNLSSKVSTIELARLVDLSASHFSALFKASAGIGVVEYTKRLRCARARELLITTDGTISEVAEAVGYEDSFYFSRHFRSVSGMSPREFRKLAHRESLGTT